MKMRDGLVPDVKVRSVSIKDIVLSAGKRNNRDDGFMWYVIKVIKSMKVNT
jgi:hypothetical protein